MSHLLAALDMNRGRLYGHVKRNKKRTTFLTFCRHLRSPYSPGVRIAIMLDNFSPHLSTKKDSRVGDWAAANNVELAYVPINASFLNRIECHFTALRYSPSTAPITAATNSRLDDPPLDHLAEPAHRR